MCYLIRYLICHLILICFRFRSCSNSKQASWRGGVADKAVRFSGEKRQFFGIGEVARWEEEEVEVKKFVTQLFVVGGVAS